MPLEGEGGYWIAKFGSPSYQLLVQNERVMLEWARECGLDVPEHRVIRASEIERLPGDFDPNQDVLVIRRFDRREGGARIHQEDFAQVFDIAPEERYACESPDLGWVHYGSIGAVVDALCGEDDHREYMRRLAFMALSGNADAHVKNWALLYPDGLKARLAPVYDFVSTVVYPSLGGHSALRWHEPLEPTVASAKSLADVTTDDLLSADLRILAVAGAPRDPRDLVVGERRSHRGDAPKAELGAAWARCSSPVRTRASSGPALAQLWLSCAPGRLRVRWGGLRAPERLGGSAGEKTARPEEKTVRRRSWWALAQESGPIRATPDRVPSKWSGSRQRRKSAFLSS